MAKSYTGKSVTTVASSSNCLALAYSKRCTTNKSYIKHWNQGSHFNLGPPLRHLSYLQVISLGSYRVGSRLLAPYLRHHALSMSHMYKVHGVGFRLLGPYLGPFALSLGQFCKTGGIGFRFLGFRRRQLALCMSHPYQMQGVEFHQCPFCSCISTPNNAHFWFVPLVSERTKWPFVSVKN